MSRRDINLSILNKCINPLMASILIPWLHSCLSFGFYQPKICGGLINPLISIKARRTLLMSKWVHSFRVIRRYSYALKGIFVQAFHREFLQSSTRRTAANCGVFPNIIPWHTCRCQNLTPTKMLQCQASRPIPLVLCVLKFILAQWCHIATEIWFNIGPGNGLLPDSTRPLSEPMLTDH